MSGAVVNNKAAFYYGFLLFYIAVLRNGGHSDMSREVTYFLSIASATGRETNCTIPNYITSSHGDGLSWHNSHLCPLPSSFDGVYVVHNPS